MGKTEKRRKENDATKVTKIPKTKRQKYGMNETLVMSKLRLRFHQILVAFSGNLNFRKATFDEKSKNSYVIVSIYF